MRRQNGQRSTPKCSWSVLVFAVGAMIATGEGSRANIIVAVPSLTTFAGASNVALDVTLTNTGPSSVNITGFVLELAGSSDITYTDVTTATSLASYIFGSNSANGPSILTPPLPASGQPAHASDHDNAGQVTVAANAEVGLGRFLFNVSPSALPGSFTISPIPVGTNLFDANGANIPIDQFGVGTVTIAAAPEPSAIAAGTTLACFLGVLLMSRRRRAHVAAEV